MSDPTTSPLDPSNISHYILSHITIWTGRVDNITAGNELRKGQPALSLPGTPALSYRNTTLGSSFASQQRTPTSRRALTPASNALKPFRAATRSPSPATSLKAKNEYRRLNSLVVHYDGDAQKQFATIYDEIKFAQNNVHRLKQSKAKSNSPDTAAEERILKLLAQVSDRVENAAFKLLQEGDATKDLDGCSNLFRELRSAVDVEWIQRYDISVQTPKPLSIPVAPNDAKALQLPPLEVDDDDDDDEMLLSNMRLTSRMAAR